MKAPPPLRRAVAAVACGGGRRWSSSPPTPPPRVRELLGPGGPQPDEWPLQSQPQCRVEVLPARPGVAAAKARISSFSPGLTLHRLRRPWERFKKITVIARGFLGGDAQEFEGISLVQVGIECWDISRIPT